MGNKRLTLKQQKFVTAYLGECRGNATKAAMAAGYAPKYADRQAYQLLENPRVQSAIAQRQNELAVASGITPEAVMLALQETVQAAKEAKQYTAAMKGIELLGKAVGLFQPGSSPPTNNSLTEALAAVQVNVNVHREDPAKVEAEPTIDAVPDRSVSFYRLGGRHIPVEEDVVDVDDRWPKEPTT